MAAEQTGDDPPGVRAVSAICQTTVPWCSVIVRNVYGVGGPATSRRAAVAALCVAVRFVGLAAAGGRHRGGLPRRDRRRAGPEAKIAEIEARLNALRSPFRTAEAFWVEEIIDPRDTRPLLCEFANLAAPLRTTGVSRFGMRP